MKFSGQLVVKLFGLLLSVPEASDHLDLKYFIDSENFPRFFILFITTRYLGVRITIEGDKGYIFKPNQ